MKPANREDGPSASSVGRVDEVAQDDRALGIAQNPRRRAATREACEERVEGADGSGEQRSATARKLPFDAVDIDPVRNDQPRIAVERVDEPVEQERDLAGMGRADDEGETHLSIVVGAFAAAFLRASVSSQRAGRVVVGRLGAAHRRTLWI